MTDDDPSEPGDPGRIRSLAVHRDDVATALEATLRSEREVVLRVTPPFSGRMRARLHSLGAGSTGEIDADGDADEETVSDDDPIHVDPRDLVSAVPPYPEVDETMAEHSAVDIETRRKRHTEAVESWRETVRQSVVDSVELGVGHGVGDGEAVDVDVTALG